jgi:DNA-directed RNA polymerase subunit RPC12/RpoP
MSVTPVRCPNCGSVASKNINSDEYKCNHCGATFYFTKPNVQKTDAVTHNCPLCGKPIPAGTGYKCTRCGKYDLCPDCVSRIEPEGHVCKDCFRKAGQDCFLCGKFAGTVCRSCQDLHKRGKQDTVVQVCWDHYSMFFIDEAEIVPSRGGMPPRWGSVTYRCPVHGEICNMCVEEKRALLRGKKIVCKACGSEIMMTEVDRSFYPAGN